VTKLSGRKHTFGVAAAATKSTSHELNNRLTAEVTRHLIVTIYISSSAQQAIHMTFAAAAVAITGHERRLLLLLREGKINKSHQIVCYAWPNLLTGLAVDDDCEPEIFLFAMF